MEKLIMEELSIEKLLDYILIIPEIQREYVWGSNKEVLTKFLSELNISLQNSKNTNIGFLYSYDTRNKEDCETRIGEHFIIDGQQRLTTIVLLAFYYAVKESKINDFKTRIKAENPLMHFSYRVRPLTEQFLQNLFADKTITIDILRDLRNAKWYVSDYENDKTIESICNLYKFIFDNEKSFCNLNYASLLQQVRFYYFDVQQTSQGEELYITMNSRGEQLKDSEQIKPYILENIKDRAVRFEAAKQWDEWEDFFFTYLQNKDLENINKIDIAIENIIKIALELYGQKNISNNSSENEKWEYNNINVPVDSKRIEFNQIKYVYNIIRELIDIKQNTIPEEIKELNFLNFLFETSRNEETLFLIETLITAISLGYAISDKNILRFIRLIKNAYVYKVKVINHEPLLKFLNKLKCKKSSEKPSNIYEYIKTIYENNPNELEGVFIKGENQEEIYKIEAIINKSASEKDIEDAEAIPVFNRNISILYRKSNDGGSIIISWEFFTKRLNELKNKLIFLDKRNLPSEAKDRLTIKEEYYVDFVSNFLSGCNDFWTQLYDKCFFDNLLSNWQLFLTDLKYLIPLDKALGLKKEEPIWKDDQKKKIWQFLKKKENIKKLHKAQYHKETNPSGGNPYGRLKNYSNKYLAFYPNGYATYKRDIIFCDNRLIQTSILNSLSNKIKVLNEKIDEYYYDWDIQFMVNKVEYAWTFDNKLKKDNKILYEFKNNNQDEQTQKLKELLHL